MGVVALVQIKYSHKLAICGALFALLQGCSGSKLAEVEKFIEQERAKPGVRIEPLPSFPPYVSTMYSAAGLRSPFEAPRDEPESELSGDEVEAPDPDRVKEYLERFNIGELTMVGTMEQNGVRWALINDGTASVHRVKAGNRLGRNHGLVESVEAGRIELTEIVGNGSGGWIRRPRSLGMATE